MDMPLTSLSWLDWLVFADWCADNDKPKRERYARRIGTALKKLALNGTGVRCAVAFRECFYGGVHVVTGWPVGGQYLTHPEAEKIGYFRCIYWTNRSPSTGPNTVWRHKEMWWLTPREAKVVVGEERYSKIKWMSPADVYEPEKHHRFIAKFWAVTVRRASGIPNEVLNEKGDRV
jgi:hypothetical protein